MSRELLQRALDALIDVGAPYSVDRSLLLSALQAELAKPEPDCVAWRIPGEGGEWEYTTELPDAASIAWSAQYGRSWEPLYAGEQPSTDGFVLVPVEPTEAMVEAGWAVDEIVTPDKTWAAMIEAAKGKV